MNLNYFFSKFRHFLFLLKNKGVKYALNKLHFFIFYGAKNPFLIKYLHFFAPYPSYIEIETTTRCNLKCRFCEHTYWQEPNKDMSFEEFKSIFVQFPKLKWIGLTGIGESFLNRDFLKMLGYLKSKNVFVEFYDNFYLIDEGTSKKLIEMEIDKIFVSMEAASKKTYEKLRIGSNFEKVINNVKNIFQLKKKTKAFFPEISFHYLITKENFQEMPKFIELAKFLAGNEKTSIQFSRLLHKFREVENLFTEVPRDIIKNTEKKAKELNVKISWNADIAQSKPTIKKCTEWVMPFIFVTGEVIPCCSANEANRRQFQKETAMGNIFEKNFREIWHGQEYKNFRMMLRQGKPPLQCKNCSLYSLTNKKQGES